MANDSNQEDTPVAVYDSISEAETQGIAARDASDVAVPEPSDARPVSKQVKTIQSVDRAFEIIEILVARQQPIGLGELAQASGLNVSTCHHLVTTLVERGYVLRTGRNRGYMLSSKLQELAERSQRKLDIADITSATLVEMAEELGMTVQLAVFDGMFLITKFTVAGAESVVKEADEISKMRATHATATGKAILAWLPEQVVANVISENGLQRFTDNTIVSLSELMDDLRLVRRNGYAEDNEELREGVACIGAALRDESGTVVASISASFAAGSLSGEQRDVVIRKVTQYARELSGRLKVSRY